MKRRMHLSTMWESEKFGGLPYEARLLMIALIDVADDQGRFKLHPAWLRSRVFPYDDVALKDISKWIDLIVGNGTVTPFSAEGINYGQLDNWWKYQRPPFAGPSLWPSPEGWKDRIRYKLGVGIVTYNWVDRRGHTINDTCDASGNIPVLTPVKTPVKTGGGTPDGSRVKEAPTPPVSPKMTPVMTQDVTPGATDQDQDQDQVIDLIDPPLTPPGGNDEEKGNSSLNTSTEEQVAILLGKHTFCWDATPKTTKSYEAMLKLYPFDKVVEALDAAIANSATHPFGYMKKIFENKPRPRKRKIGTIPRTKKNTHTGPEEGVIVKHSMP